MAGFLDDIEIVIPCDQCGSKSKKRIRWIKANKEYTCPCGNAIALDTDEVRRKITQAERDIASLQKDLKKFGKR